MKVWLSSKNIPMTNLSSIMAPDVGNGQGTSLAQLHFQTLHGFGPLKIVKVMARMQGWRSKERPGQSLRCLSWVSVFWKRLDRRWSSTFWDPGAACWTSEIMIVVDQKQQCFFALRPGRCWLWAQNRSALRLQHWLPEPTFVCHSESIHIECVSLVFATCQLQMFGAEMHRSLFLAEMVLFYEAGRLFMQSVSKPSMYCNMWKNQCSKLDRLWFPIAIATIARAALWEFLHLLSS